MRSHQSIAILLVLVAATYAEAQTAAQTAPRAERSGRRALLPLAEEIALARSAAPANVSDSATIYVLADTGFTVAVRGSNGAACYVNRSWSLSIEPHCFDPEGAATVMPMSMRRVELLHSGKGEVAVDQQVAIELAAGRFRLPQRPAMSYMMSSAQVLYNSEGLRVGSWQPHLMIYYPFLRGSDVGMSTPDYTTAIIDAEGKPGANIMVIVKQFVDPRRIAPSR